MNSRSIRIGVCLSVFFSLRVALIAAEKPNVVLFLVDDMGWMDCGVYGSKYYQTPNIDRFAQRAMRFTNAYANPLCSPTRASILTGQYSSRHGILTASGHQPPQPAGHNFLPDSASPNRPMISPESKNYLELSAYTLSEALHDNGYRTAHLGKWHLGLTDEYRPDKHGFETTFHCAPDPGPPGNYFSPYGVTPVGKPSAKTKIGNITDGPDGEYIVDRLADEALKFIEASKGQPFFLNLWCYGVHGPWGHRPAYTAEFAKKSDPTGLQGNPIMASMLQSVDECFGRILDELDRQRVTDNTIILFYSDNGGNTHSNVPGTSKTEAAESSRSDAMTEWRRLAGDRPPTNNAPLRDGKGTLYEGGTRVPMMWSWNGRIAPNTTNETIAAHIDIYPTLLELLGISKKPNQIIDGVSLVPVLEGRGQLDRKAFFNFFPFRPNDGGVTVRSGDYKLIRWFGNGVPRELYNLKADIGESKNLADAMPEKVLELDRLIDGYLKDTQALVPQPNPNYKASNRATPSATSNGDIDVTRGLVPKQCIVTPVEGAIRVDADGRQPFLGTVQVKHKGAMTLLMKARSANGGPGKIQWRTADQETFPDTGQVVDFPWPATSEWQEVKVSIPIQGTSGTIRLYLPGASSSVEIQSIQFVADGSAKPIHVWNFSK